MGFQKFQTKNKNILHFYFRLHTQELHGKNDFAEGSKILLEI